MGCGLSQLSRTQRGRVWDVSVSGSSQKSISTSAEATGPAVRDLAMGRGTGHLSPTLSDDGSMDVEPIRQMKKVSDGAAARSQTPDVKREKISVASSNSTATTVASEGARPKSSTAQSQNKGRSSVSVKSLSDQDSGYKDDSQPEEGDDGRLSVSPWTERAALGAAHPLSDIASSDSENEATMPPIRERIHSCPRIHAGVDAGAPDCGARAQDDTFLPVRPLCTCGYSHQKQDGYVETYDNGYLDSSYEDLRSLAHEGSVFSIDILCHSTQDGSHRQHKIPLYVHKPTGNPAAHEQQQPHQREARYTTTSSSSHTGSSTASAFNYGHYNYPGSANHHAHRPANPLDFQYHFHHARAQVNNRPFKSYDARDPGDAANHSSSSSVSTTSGVPGGVTVAGPPAAARRRHTSIGGMPTTDYMLYQLDNYENMLAQHRRANRAAQKDQANDDEIKSLHD